LCLLKISTISLLKFKQVSIYLTIDSIPACKGGQPFFEKDSIPMFALVIRIHKDEIRIRRLRCNNSGPSHLQKLVKYNNLSIHKFMQIKN
jgi:hypothetical protein